MYVRASASAGGWGGGSPLVVHRGQDAEVSVGDRDASVLEPALLRPNFVVDVLPRKTTVRPLLGPRPTTTARQASQTQRALATWAP